MAVVVHPYLHTPFVRHVSAPAERKLFNGLFLSARQFRETAKGEWEFFLQIPRGKISDWKSFAEYSVSASFPDAASLSARHRQYSRDWYAVYPDASVWFRILLSGKNGIRKVRLGWNGLLIVDQPAKGTDAVPASMSVHILSYAEKQLQTVYWSFLDPFPQYTRFVEKYLPASERFGTVGRQRVAPEGAQAEALRKYFGREVPYSLYCHLTPEEQQKIHWHKPIAVGQLLAAKPDCPQTEHQAGSGQEQTA